MAPTGKPSELAFSGRLVTFAGVLKYDAFPLSDVLKFVLEVGTQAMGCHVDSAVWPRWHKLIAETSSIPIYDHSLEDVSKAFSAAGFTVAARPLDLDAFMPVTVGSAYFPKVVDQLRYYS